MESIKSFEVKQGNFGYRYNTNFNLLNKMNKIYLRCYLLLKVMGSLVVKYINNFLLLIEINHNNLIIFRKSAECLSTNKHKSTNINSLCFMSKWRSSSPAKWNFNILQIHLPTKYPPTSKISLYSIRMSSLSKKPENSFYKLMSILSHKKVQNMYQAYSNWI